MKYQAKKGSKPMSILDSLIKYKDLKQKRIVAKERLSEIDAALKELSNGNHSLKEYTELKEKQIKTTNFLKNSDRLMSSLKRKFIKISSIALASTILLCGSISAATNAKDSNLTENISQAITVISEYPEFNTNKEDLGAIKENPSQITQLALNCLKAKIAEHLNISDPTTIKILDNSTSLSSSAYNSYGNGFLNDLSIKVNGKTIAIYNAFTPNGNGETIINAQSMSDAIVANINNISNAQGAIATRAINANSLASKALEEVNNLDPLDISFPDAAKNLKQDSQFLVDDGR